MRFGSLFAGIGGFDLGLERAGMECAWQVEIDEFCNKVLAKHWPHVERHRDVHDVGKHNLRPVDLICAGDPCQPHSLAGKRGGAEDDRYLWAQVVRIVAELRPRWVIRENVPGIRTTTLDQDISDLEGLDYTTGTLIVPAVGLDAPHRRDRIWIVAYASRPGGWENSRGSLGNEETHEGRGAQNHHIIAGDGKGGRAGIVAHADRGHSNGREHQPWRQTPGRTSPNGHSKSRQPGWWSVEPDVGRVAHGVPARVDRLRSLGNAVVPQVVEWLGRNIMAVEAELNGE